MLVQVIPLERTFTSDPLTYLFPDSFNSEIAKWSIVEVPFWKKLQNAIVSDIIDLNISSDDNKLLLDNIAESLNLKDIKSLKSVSRIISSIPVISENTIKIILELALIYWSNINTIARIFFPKAYETYLDKKNYLVLDVNMSASNNKSNELKTSKSSFNYIWTTPNTLNTKLLDLLSNEFNKKNLLIIFPNYNWLNNFRLGLNNDTKYLEYSNALTPVKKYKTLIKILNKDYKIILWTRELLLTPYLDSAYYKDIIYIEDWWNDKFYRMPQIFEYNELLYIYNKLWFNINVLSSYPSVKTLFKAQKN